MVITGFLKTILETRKQDLDQARSRIGMADIRRLAEDQPAGPDFYQALSARTAASVGIIAEIKKASPSKGDIRPDLDPAELAQAYTRAGAAAISVLTEERYFKGSLSDLKAARNVSTLPILRKDFTLSSYQIYEARAFGANAVLLITAMLSREQLSDYSALSRELGMEPLVEIHSEWEFEKALQCQARVIGINNRNLMTLETDLEVSSRLAPLFMPGQVPVEASGIRQRSDIDKGLKDGYANFLVGESIVRAADTEAFIRSLIEPAPSDHQRGPESAVQIPKKKLHPLIKICGLTDPAQAAECARLGADAIGLVFYPKSPRNVGTDLARKIIRALPAGTIATGVFVDTPVETILEIARECGLAAVQLHGQEFPQTVARLRQAGLAVIKALFAESAPGFDRAADFTEASALLVECGKGDLPGGNAEDWDWARARLLPREKPLVLAGGLSPANVGRAIEAAAPDWVDVSSGVEHSRGVKDLDQVAAFIRAVRS